jgi:hypothetical protein
MKWNIINAAKAAKCHFQSCSNHILLTSPPFWNFPGNTNYRGRFFAYRIYHGDRLPCATTNALAPAGAYHHARHTTALVIFTNIFPCINKKMWYTMLLPFNLVIFKLLSWIREWSKWGGPWKKFDVYGGRPKILDLLGGRSNIFGYQRKENVFSML